MNKYIKTLFFCCFIILGFVFYDLTSSKSPYYKDIQSYIDDNQSTYFEFYDIDAYLSDKPKRTLSDINNIEVHYNINPKENYNITIKKENFEIIYRMETDFIPEEEIQNCVLIDASNQTYLEEDETFLSVKCFFDDNTLLSVSVRDINNYDISTLQDILLKLMKDSVELNR